MWAADLPRNFNFVEQKGLKEIKWQNDRIENLFMKEIMLITINLFHIYKSSDSEKYSRWSIYMAAEEVTAAMDKDINDHNEDGGHQDWPYKEIVAIAGKHKSINILLGC